MPRYEGMSWCKRHNRPINYELKHSGLPCIKPSENPYIGPRLQCGSCPDQSYRVTRDGVEIPHNTHWDVLDLALLEIMKKGNHDITGEIS